MVVTDPLNGSSCTFFINFNESLSKEQQFGEKVKVAVPVATKHSKTGTVGDGEYSKFLVEGSGQLETTGLRQVDNETAVMVPIMSEQEWDKISKLNA